MISIRDKSQCCGCTACASVCAHDAIIMKPDVLGFLYPHVDHSKCVDCGQCEKVCAFTKHYDTSANVRLQAYAARHKDLHEVETSRSGAAFIAISDYVLDNGGAIYGVGYTGHFKITHKRAINKEERNEFKGSKYVQSDLTTIFRQVKKDLMNGLIVLFSGTPCQTSGLNSYVGNKLRKQLILVDIVCHGVSAPFLWEDYLNYLERKNGKKIIEVNFRDKELFGWGPHRETFKFLGSNKKICYKYVFYQYTIYRDSCYQCPFANMTRPSDITIGDFWGWERTDRNINKDAKGVSLILLNTEKGMQIFDIIKYKMDIVPAKIENCIQPNLQKPTSLPPYRKNYENDYIKYGFEYVMKKYGNIGWRYKITRLKNKLTNVRKRFF